MVDKKLLKSLLIFCENLTRSAGEILLKESGKATVVKRKDLQDIATTADMKSERYIISRINNDYPKHDTISEESGKDISGSEYCWFIDPLDGTKEYFRNMPLYNVSIALQHKSKLIVSSVFRPSDNTLFSAADGIGSFRNGKKIMISDVSALNNSFTYCYLPSYHRDKEKYNKAWLKLSNLGKHVYRLRTSSDENSALCWLAQGSIEAFVNISNPPKDWHDIAPGLLIAKEAGAAITSDMISDISAQKLPIIVANNQKIKHEIEDVLKMV